MTGAGWEKGTQARSTTSAGVRPYTFWNAGALTDSYAREKDSPARTLAITPWRVVRFQNRSKTKAGRLALAATLNAQPTRNPALKFLKRMPSPLATIPIPTVLLRALEASLTVY